MTRKVTVICDARGRIEAIVGSGHRLLRVGLPAELAAAEQEDKIELELRENYCVSVDCAGPHFWRLAPRSESGRSA
jgi:hypothetical protein